VVIRMFRTEQGTDPVGRVVPKTNGQTTFPLPHSTLTINHGWVICDLHRAKSFVAALLIGFIDTTDPMIRIPRQRYSTTDGSIGVPTSLKGQSTACLFITEEGCFAGTFFIQSSRKFSYLIFSQRTTSVIDY